MLQMIMSLLSMLGQGSQTQPGSSNMQALSSFKEGGGPGGMFGGQGYAGKDTYGSTGKSVAANMFDPGGFMRPGGDKEDEKTMFDMLDEMMNWQRGQPEYKAYKGEVDKMGADPNYGAIQPDWGEIWDNYENKINQHYWGSPTKGGVNDQIKASSARRGVQDSPAEGELMARMAAEQAGEISDLGVKQGIQKTNLTSSAKSDYMNRLAGFANQSQMQNFSSLLPMFYEDSLPAAPNNSGMAGAGGMLSDILANKAGSQPSSVGATAPARGQASTAGAGMGSIAPLLSYLNTSGGN